MNETDKILVVILLIACFFIELALSDFVKNLTLYFLAPTGAAILFLLWNMFKNA